MSVKLLLAVDRRLIGEFEENVALYSIFKKDSCLYWIDFKLVRLYSKKIYIYFSFIILRPSYIDK